MAPSEEGHFSAEEIRRRAVSGTAVDVLRGFGARCVGLVGTLVLARLLTPHDFGLVAFGATIVTFASFLADGGIGAGLIRRVESPERADLKALFAFQLGLSTALAAVIGIALLPFGEFGQLTAVMAIALPLTAFRVAGLILLERQLNYKPIALIDIAEALGYFGCAIVLVSYGWGVWGLATASVVRALTGSAVLLAMVPSARMIPVFSFARVRPLFAFGFRYQAVGVVNLLRDQGMNAAIAIFAGVSALGLWTVAVRVLEVYLVFLNALRRVSFPGMSRLVAAREDLGPTIERVVAVVSVVSGLILAPLVAASPAWVPALLGDQWEGAVAVIPPACLQLMVIGPMSVALIGYLWALGEASAVLRAALVGIPLMAAVLIPLLLVIGAPAVGFGWMAAGAGEAFVLIAAARRHAEFRITPALLPPTVFAVIAGTLGWLAATAVGVTLLGGLVGGLCAAAVYLATLAVWHRTHLVDTFQLSVRGLRDAVRSPTGT